MGAGKKPLIRIDQARLDDIIVKHRLFSESRPGGKRALLTNHDLSGLVFCGCNLFQADFTGSILYEADLEFATLNQAVFFGCDLRKANFRNAKMQRADLRGAVLRGAIMAGADLTNADMREGSFATYDMASGLTFTKDSDSWKEGVGGVDLRGANMSSIKLSGAVAMNSNMEDANLANAKAIRANFKGANMARANLANADFTHCELRDIDMRGANLVGALMDFSSLVNVDMTGALTDKPAGKTIDQLPLPLDQMLALHHVWLDTRGARGQRLDVGGFDMRDVMTMSQADMTMLLADHTVWYAHDLSAAKLQAAHFKFSDMRNCNFAKSDIRGSNFSKANLVGSKFTDIKAAPLLLEAKRLLKTNFTEANLRYADFRYADLTDADFTGADLSFADFTGAILKNTTFFNAILDDTKMANAPDTHLIIIREDAKKN